MWKDLHAVEFDETTFGMPIDTSTEAYSRFKKAIVEEKAISYFGNEMTIKTIPYLALAGIMREARWLVAESKLFNKIQIDGLANNDFIYVKYTEIQLDFRERFSNVN